MGRTSDDKKPLQLMSLNSADKSADHDAALYGLNDDTDRRLAVAANIDQPEILFSPNIVRQQNGGIHQPLSSTTSTMYQSHETAEAYGSGSRSNPRVCGAGSRSAARSISREKAVATDRQRRLRIAERLKALQEVLPYTVEGGQLALLDEIMDHIKYLQLQIQDLTHTRLGGETALDALVYLEGHGHYILHEEMLNEPLEETFGKLLELNTSAAIQLMESRDLYIVPTTFVDDLDQAI